MNRIDIVKLLREFSERWMITSGLMIVGGLFGFFVSQARPPIFESVATFSVTIDYTQTGALSDIQEDQAMRGVGSVIFSDSAIDKVQAMIMNESGIILSKSDFLRNAFLDREEFRWTLRYRDPDQKFAEMAVNAWSKSANTLIQEGLAHSLTSRSLLEELETFKICLSGPSNGNNQSFCENLDINLLVTSINEISAKIQAEKAASLGLFHALSVSLVQDGIPTTSAEFGQRNLLVLSGVMIGLLLSIILSLVEEIKRSRSI